jgi:hypothetical protein
MMIGTFYPKTLVTVCAAGGKRPDWRDEEPKPQRMLSANGKEMIEGECEGRNRYSLGAYCPLDWQPSPTTVVPIMPCGGKHSASLRQRLSWKSLSCYHPARRPRLGSARLMAVAR